MQSHPSCDIHYYSHGWCCTLQGQGQRYAHGGGQKLGFRPGCIPGRELDDNCYQQRSHPRQNRKHPLAPVLGCDFEEGANGSQHDNYLQYRFNNLQTAQEHLQVVEDILRHKSTKQDSVELLKPETFLRYHSNFLSESSKCYDTVIRIYPVLFWEGFCWQSLISSAAKTGQIHHYKFRSYGQESLSIILQASRNISPPNSQAEATGIGNDHEEMPGIDSSKANGVR